MQFRPVVSAIVLKLHLKTCGYLLIIWDSAKWASEASPTFVCSIKISREICRSVCLSCPKCVGGITLAHAHARSHFWVINTNL